MKQKRHTPEEIIKKLREAATLLAGGQGVEEVCKKLEVSPPTYHRWKEQYGGSKEETLDHLMTSDSAKECALFGDSQASKRTGKGEWTAQTNRSRHGS
jgi:putative transposase